MSQISDRRQFLRGRFRGGPVDLLPPWAGVRTDFLERCTRCGSCINACPSGILVKGDGDYPTVNFDRGECTFCGDCVEVCAPRALLNKDKQPWILKPVVHESCLAWQGIDCRRCAETCASGALSIMLDNNGRSLPIAHAPACTGCGACVAPCPVRAIHVVEVAA